MKILVGDKRNVDFDSPLKMTDEEKNRFIEFLKSMFSVVNTKDVDYFRRERLGDKIFAKGWDTEELKLLLDPELDNDTIAGMLGRSWLSVDIKRGPLMSELLHWAGETNKNFLEGDKKKIIEEFVNYKLDKKNRIRALKKEAREIRNEYADPSDSGLDNIDYWRSRQERLREMELEIAKLEDN